VLPSLPPSAALFFDVDGTLVPIVPDPRAVRVERALLAQLSSLQSRFDGAVALLSGRPLDTLDQLFAPLRLPAAGLHGLQRRYANGQVHQSVTESEFMQAARAALAGFVRSELGLVLEDKGETVAVHFRAVPALGPRVLDYMNALAQRFGPGLQVLRGQFVLELKSRRENKGTALRAFMHEAPFRGRVPVMIGDDITDVDAFIAAESLGGFSIAVGNAVSARWQVASPHELLDWLSA
jgi:trehalose 6-phosphate phosphatase